MGLLFFSPRISASKRHTCVGALLLELHGTGPSFHASSTLLFFHNGQCGDSSAANMTQTIGIDKMDNYSFWLCICVHGWMWSLDIQVHQWFICAAVDNTCSHLVFPFVTLPGLLTFHFSGLSLVMSFGLVYAYFGLGYFLSVSISICTCLSLSLCLASLSSQSFLFCWLNSLLFWAANRALSQKLFCLFRVTE